ncbi:cell division protein FtsL [Streptococcus chenjunshii]|uniref:Cell division protein FtsL n=1 Tax=Streptococcus chenjunshii TaxID=2173853 RepID=A0A372KK88_9STRE|nr:cell division protein FtsL [Streptococcus chenjunshii]AXQ79256.1 cell division protein FtsL [Streptococcus chenjunshii]RFU50563.1 cell division protein FtsL [Streptococcus chenjunshii]RFU52324.1 cell division protein FtsL [Streptococcus chenjunshii]
MTNEKRTEAVTNVLQKRIRTFSRIEKAFYGAIILTAITMAVSIVYLQSRNLQVQQEITNLNSQINDKETELNNAKQEVAELSGRDRILQIATESGLSSENANISEVK